MNAAQRRIYDMVFQRPMTHNLEWRDVKTLMESIGTVVAEHNGNATVTVGSNTKVFHSPANSDLMSSDQIIDVRHLLTGVLTVAPEVPDFQALLVLNHSGARIYQMQLNDSIPVKVEPYDPSGHRDQVHANHDYFKNAERANQDEFYRSVAKSLAGADQIVIFGSGTGSSNAMAAFARWLKQNNELLHSRVVGTRKIDESHATENQLLSKARKCTLR